MGVMSSSLIILLFYNVVRCGVVDTPTYAKPSCNWLVKKRFFGRAVRRLP